MWVKPLSGAEFDMVFKLASGGDGSVTRNEIGMLLSLHRAVSRWRHVIEKVFAEYDTDNNGSLDAAELGLFARKLDPKASADEVNTLLAKLFKVDKSGDGTLSREELLTAICYWRSVVSEARQAARDRVFKALLCFWVPCYWVPIETGHETKRKDGTHPIGAPSPQGPWHPGKQSAPLQEGEKKNKKTARVEPSSNVVEAVAVPVVYVLPADALLELVDMSAPIVATAVAIPT